MEGKLLAPHPAVHAGLRPALGMAKRKHITIRPRVNSDLERIHEERRKEFPDLIHGWATSWASQFAEMAAASSKGEKTDD